MTPLRGIAVFLFAVIAPLPAVRHCMHSVLALRATSYMYSPWAAMCVVHAEEASRRLAAVGFQKLSEKQEWKLKPGGRYYFTRNLSTIVAFAVGAKYKPGNGLHMIGAHTDR